MVTMIRLPAEMRGPKEAHGVVPAVVIIPPRRRRCHHFRLAAA